ncbi:hypothetical protein KIN20_028879 [Parelaphostrongylus tenuis]|uniref:Uncharacterized protein n=1 Tax=Parelaphostrongylus tenuis TaxID=148309 RepID=A0AAD5R1R2_PARTN|nr:hypothetical protein KIN20_028879 [Parelaphostrongylus tenuis]
MHESGFRVEKIADKVKRFLARDSAKIRVGDRYELRLTMVDRNHSGYYRCVNKHGRRVVSMMYFLDVISKVNIQMLEHVLNGFPFRLHSVTFLATGALRSKNVSHQIHCPQSLVLLMDLLLRTVRVKTSPVKNCSNQELHTTMPLDAGVAFAD